jgi:putative tricarboxylic transport membrane protein
VAILVSTLWRGWRDRRVPDRRNRQKKTSQAFSKRLSARTTRHFENRTKQQRRRRFNDHLGS